MRRSLETLPDAMSAPTLSAADLRARLPARPGAATSGSAQPVETRYRVRPECLYMASSFREGPGKAYRGEVQKVLQTLRWDPLDGRLVALAPGSGPRLEEGEPGRDGDRAAAVRGFGLGPHVADWLRQRGLDEAPRGMAAGLGLSLLELCSCVTLDPDSADAAAARAALEAESLAAGRAIYAGSARFHWRTTFHLALPDAIGVGGPATPDEAWHAEGGQYQARAPVFEGAVWRRRCGPPSGRRRVDPLSRGQEGSAENSRPADSFDPRPAYRFDGLDAAERDLRFRPFVLRVGGLDPWPLDPLLRDPATAAAPRRPGAAKDGGLAAWYWPCDGNLTMTWAVSPAIVRLSRPA